MRISRRIGAAATAVGLAVLVPATAAGAFTISQSPAAGQIPGQPTTITLDFDTAGNCGLDVTGAEVVDVMIQDTLNQDVPAARVENVDYDEGTGQLVFTVNIPTTTVFGQWQFFVVRDGTVALGNVVGETSISQIAAQCLTDGDLAVGTFEVLDPAAIPLVPMPVAIGAGLTATGLAAATVVRRRRATVSRLA